MPRDPKFQEMMDDLRAQEKQLLKEEKRLETPIADFFADATRLASTILGQAWKATKARFSDAPKDNNDPNGPCP